MKTFLRVIKYLVVYYVIIAFIHFLVYFSGGYKYFGFDYFFKDLWDSFFGGWIETILLFLGIMKYPEPVVFKATVYTYIFLVLVLLVPFLMLLWVKNYRKVKESMKTFIRNKKSNTKSSRIEALEREIEKLKKE